MTIEDKNEGIILVTGGTGFLGCELISQLIAQNKRVRALKRDHSRIPEILQKNPLVEWFDADINEFATLEDAFQDVKQVYHCAAMVSFNPDDKNELFRVNIEGTSNIVNLCIQYEARLVHVSSVAALGNAKKGMSITENDFWEYDPNVHSYAISKYESEMEVWRGIAEGLDAVIVNPSVIIGKNSGTKGSGAIFKLIRDGLKFYTKGATGLVDVEDVAKCMILLMQSDICNERFTISAENLNYQELFTLIAQGFNKMPPALEAKPWMLRLAWRAAKLFSFLTGSSPALTRDSARSSFNESYYSNEKIKQTIPINFKPINHSIKEICIALTTK